MNTDRLIEQLSATTGKTPEEVSGLIGALSETIRDYCADIDAVAIPGFGTFQPIKHNESVRTDIATGKQMLVPPAITVNFKSSVVLRKKFVG